MFCGFHALRRAGFLQLLYGTKVGTEPEYESFVRKTQFDYRRDLDTALISFAPDGKFLLLKGRFDWKSLHAYVDDENGKCYNSLCQMAGSAPERQISFFPVQSGLMALAVSVGHNAALRMNTAARGPMRRSPMRRCGSPSRPRFSNPRPTCRTGPACSPEEWSGPKLSPWASRRKEAA